MAIPGAAVIAHQTIPTAPALVTERELREYGARLGAALQAPVFVALRGDLGAGKTTLVQAIARGAGVADEVTSPTYALVHEYAGARARVYHIDLYRIESPGDLTNLGWDDIVASRAIVLVEWPERAGARLPRERLDVTLAEVPGHDDQRSVRVEWKA